MKKLIHFNIIAILLLTMAACGGGSDSGGGDTGGGGTGGNTAASVNAGLDQDINEQAAATVTAVGFPAGGNFSWTQIAGPVLAEFPSTANTVTLTAPSVKTEQELTFRVEYTATDGTIVSDSLSVTIAPINHNPVAVATRTAPTTSNVAPSSTVVLDGSTSYDQDVDGVISSYEWEQGAGSPAVSQLNGTESAQFHFVAPEVSTTTEFPFTLTVTDDEGASAEYELVVVVDPDQTLVAVDGGPDVVVNEEQTVILTATGDPIGGTYTWSQLTGDALANFPLTGAVAQFVTLATKTVKNYEFLVQYQSPTGFIAEDRVSVIVNPVNLKPVAVIRVLTPALLPAQPSELVTLDGSASTDSDGSIVSYAWSQRSGTVTIPPETSSDPMVFKFRAPVQTNPESYVYRLTVTDDEGGEASFDMEIEVIGTTDLIVADAGANQLADEFATVTLDGQASFSSVSAVTCSWRLVSGPTVSFNNPNNCISTFVAPNVDVNTDLIFELKVTNTDDDQATDVTTVTVKPIALGKITDSGQVACYNQSQEVPCGDSNYPRQDADFGRDSVSGFLDKVGTGEAGFDYTKLGANGDEIADDATDHACIRDNFTGLIWEIKVVSTDNVPNTGLRDNKNTYVWHYPDGSTGGESGTASDPLTTCPSADDCGLETYVKDVNITVFCGGSNWRVPTMVEMQSIINYSKGNVTGAVDTNIFNDLPSDTLLGHQYYWSAETSADGGGKQSSWVMDFGTGNDNTLPKIQSAYVRLVRTP
ncbi:MAG: hypothetical protein ACI8WB_003934 [Phenylobacterium sp.]|jgi:hypothetical protein